MGRSDVQFRGDGMLLGFVLLPALVLREAAFVHGGQPGNETVFKQRSDQ